MFTDIVSMGFGYAYPRSLLNDLTIDHVLRDGGEPMLERHVFLFVGHGRFHHRDDHTQTAVSESLTK